MLEPALFARVFLFGKLLDDYLLAVMHIYALHRRPIPYVDLGASMCCAGLSLQQKKSPLSFTGRRGFVEPIRNRTLPLGNLPDRSVSEADDVDGIAKSMVNILSDSKKQKEMSAGSLKLVQKHDISYTLTRMEEIYEKVLAARDDAMLEQKKKKK